MSLALHLNGDVYPVHELRAQDALADPQNMSLFESTIWIVHRDAGPRGALGRLAGAAPGRHQIVLGGPGDSVFDAASRADLVVLDVSTALADPDAELDLARRVQRDNPDCAWILVTAPGTLETTLRLFDTLDAQVIAGPPDTRTLGPAVSAALARSRVLPLSQRVGRDHLSARFVRWFSAAEPRELALALDPRLSSEPVLARGEVGTGRGLLLRYVHVTSTVDPGAFIRVACTPESSPEDLVAQIEDGVREAGRATGRYGIWLDELDRLGSASQARVLDWMEFGAPAVLPGSLRARARWFASVSSDPMRMSVRMTLAFAELCIRTVPLRDRPQVIPSFVADTARAWASARRETPKSFDAPAVDLLRNEPWPGNLAELEAVVIRSLAHADPEATGLRIADLRFGSDFEDDGVPRTTAAEATEVAPATHFEPTTHFEPEANREPEAEIVVLPKEPERTPKPERPLAQAAPASLGDAGDEGFVELEPELEGEVLPPTAEIIDLQLPDTQEEQEEQAEAPIAGTPDANSISRLAKAVAHEVRNPLVSIRTFSDLLHDHYADEDFRDRFGSLVASDVRRIEEVVEQLEQMGEPGEEAAPVPVDLTGLLETLLDEQRAGIQAKRLLVLKELDRARPEALGDAALLRSALAGLLDRAIGEAPERGDLYLASRHQPQSEEKAGIRILIRYGVTETASDSDLAIETLRATNLQAEVAQSIIERLHGSLRVDTESPTETLVVIDLPAPPAPL